MKGRYRGCVLWTLVVLGLMAWPAETLGDSRFLWLYNVHTEEEIRLRPFAGSVRLDPLEWRRLNRFFRSWRTGRRRTMHPRLMRTLAQIQTHFGKKRIEVVSGYRVPEDGDDLTSYHQVGRAADVRLDGVDKRDLFEYCRTLERLGCGYYPKTTFVHIDVRGTSGVWVDLSTSGEPARYVSDPRRWLKLHR